MQKERQNNIQMISLIIAILYIFAQYNVLVSLRNKIKMKEYEISSAYQYRIDTLTSTFQIINEDYRTAPIKTELNSSLDDLQMAVNIGNVKQMSIYNRELVKEFSELLRVLDSEAELQSMKEGITKQILKSQDIILTSYNGYYELIEDYNNKVTSYPGFIYAKLFRFKPHEYVRDWS